MIGSLELSMDGGPVVDRNAVLRESSPNRQSRSCEKTALRDVGSHAQVREGVGTEVVPNPVSQPSRAGHIGSIAPVQVAPEDLVVHFQQRMPGSRGSGVRAKR